MPCMQSVSASSVDDANTPPNPMNMLSPDHAHRPLPIFPNPDEVYQAAMAVANSPRVLRTPDLPPEDDDDDLIAPPGRFRDTTYNDATSRGPRRSRHARESERYGTPDYSERSSGYSTPTTRVSRAAERTPLGFVPVRTGDDYFTSTLEQHPIRTPSPADHTAAQQRQRPHVPPLDTTGHAWPPMEVEMSPHSSQGTRSGSSRSPRYEEAPIPAGVQYPEAPIVRGGTPSGRRRRSSSPHAQAPQVRGNRQSIRGSGHSSRIVVADPENLASPISLFNNR